MAAAAQRQESICQHKGDGKVGFGPVKAALPAWQERREDVKQTPKTSVYPMAKAQSPRLFIGSLAGVMQPMQGG